MITSALLYQRDSLPGGSFVAVVVVTLGSGVVVCSGTVVSGAVCSGVGSVASRKNKSVIFIYILYLY